MEESGSRQLTAESPLAEESRTRAQNDWPGVHLTDERWAAVLAQVASSGQPIPSNSSDFYLATACGDGVPAAIAACKGAYGALVRDALVRVGLQPPDVDDAVQSVWTHLLAADEGQTPRMRSYQGRGELRHWLRAVATRIGIGVRRRTKAPLVSLDETEPIAPGDDLELSYWKRLHQAAFETSFLAAFSELDDEDRLLLKQRFRHTIGFEALARLHGISTSTAFRRVEAARLRLVEGTRQCLQRTLKATPTEMSSLFRVVPSEVELCLSSVELSGETDRRVASPRSRALK